MESVMLIRRLRVRVRWVVYQQLDGQRRTRTRSLTRLRQGGQSRIVPLPARDRCAPATGSASSGRDGKRIFQSFGVSVDPGFTSRSANIGGITSHTLETPESVTIHGSRLIVTDTGRNDLGPHRPNEEVDAFDPSGPVVDFRMRGRVAGSSGTSHERLQWWHLNTVTA